jgi:hypothetical protein
MIIISQHAFHPMWNAATRAIHCARPATPTFDWKMCRGGGVEPIAVSRQVVRCLGTIMSSQSVGFLALRSFHWLIARASGSAQPEEQQHHVINPGSTLESLVSRPNGQKSVLFRLRYWQRVVYYAHLFPSCLYFELKRKATHGN